MESSRSRLVLRLACLCGLTLLPAMPAHAQTIAHLIFFPATEPQTIPPASSQAVDITRMPLLNQPDFTAAMAGFIGQDLSAPTLSATPPLAVDALKRAGWPSSRVTILQPDPSTGTVRALVTLYAVRTVTIEGNQYYSPAYYRSAL